MDISTEDIKKFVNRIEDLTAIAFRLDMKDPYIEDSMDYYHHGLWLLLEDCFGISPNDMKAKYRIEKV